MRPAPGRPGPLARLRALLFPGPAIVSAVEPEAQPALRILNDRLAAFYNSPVVTQYFSTGEAINAEWSAAFKPHIHLHDSVPVGATVLDIGCGSAHPARHLKDRLGKYIGIDWSEAQVEANRGQAPEHDFIAGSVYEVPLPDATADVVISLYVIEHCVWPHRMLEEMYRLAKPGGLVAILTPPFRHRSYLKSLPYGLSARPIGDKLRSLSLVDAALHVYHHRVWYPLYLRHRHPQSTPEGRFLIYLDPVCLTHREWFPDADAVYIADTAEVLASLVEQGAQPVAHWPEWGYVLVRKPMGKAVAG